MKDFFCLDCEHSWVCVDHEPCPHCGSSEVAFEKLSNEGHYEGDFTHSLLDDFQE